MIEDFFTIKVDTQRLIRDPLDDTEGWDVYLSEIMVHIQTWEVGEAGYIGAKFPTHQLWTYIDYDIVEGDRIDSGDNIYEVLKVEDRSYGENQHKFVLLVLLEPEDEES